MTILYFIVASKTFNNQTQIKNLDGKPIVRSGGANHFINGEAVGGKLCLLTDKIQFQSPYFNIQSHGQTIYIEPIKEVSFYNILGYNPDGLAMINRGAQTGKFVVNGRRLWKEKIEQLKANS